MKGAGGWGGVLISELQPNGSENRNTHEVWTAQKIETLTKFEVLTVVPCNLYLRARNKLRLITLAKLVFKLVQTLRDLRVSLQRCHRTPCFRAWSRTAWVSRHRSSSKRRKIIGPRTLCNIPEGKPLVYFLSQLSLLFLWCSVIKYFIWGNPRLLGDDKCKGWWDVQPCILAHGTDPCILNMTAKHTFEMLVPVYQAIRCHIPKHRFLIRLTFIYWPFNPNAAVDGQS